MSPNIAHVPAFISAAFNGPLISEPVYITSIRHKLISKNPITGLDKPKRFEEAEAARFHDNRYMKVVRLSAQRTARYTPGNIPVTHFCWRLSQQPQGHSAAGRIMSMKKIHWHQRESNPRTSGLYRSAYI